MKRITHSKKTLGAVLIGAAGLALGTVGFSAWVVGNGTVDSGNSSLGVSVAGVTDNLVSFESGPAWDNTAANICVAGDDNDSDKMLVDNASNIGAAYIVFGPRHDDHTDPIVVQNDGAINDIEHLWVRFGFSVSWPDNKGLDITINFANTTGGNALSKLSAGATGNYIVNPDGVTAGEKVLLSNYTTAVNPTASGTTTGWTIGAATSPTTANNRKTQSFTVTMTWAWGSEFGGNNPSEATNSNAASYLTKLNTMLGSGVMGGISGSLNMTVTAAIHSAS